MLRDALLLLLLLHAYTELRLVARLVLMKTPPEDMGRSRAAAPADLKRALQRVKLATVGTPLTKAVIAKAKVRRGKEGLIGLSRF